MQSKAKDEKDKNINNNYEYIPKSIKIDISREDDEDRELISLLEEKRKFFKIISTYFFILLK